MTTVTNALSNVSRTQAFANGVVDRAPFEQTASLVLGTFQRAVIELLAALPLDSYKVLDISQTLGINRLLGWQLYRIVNSSNPLAVGAHVPVKASMKKVLASAERLRVPLEVVEHAAEAFEAFEQFVEANASDRGELEAMLSDFLPEERSKQELAGRETAFRGMSQVKGVTTETDVITLFFKVSEDGLAVDRVTLTAMMGLRRSRADVPLVFGVGDFTPRPDIVLTLDGTPSEQPLGGLLPQFSTSPLPGLDVHRAPDGMIYYCLAGQDVGLRSAADLVTADVRPKMLPRYWEVDQPRYRGPSYHIDSPVRRMTFDVFLHRDVYPGVSPELRVYDAVSRGEVVEFDDPARKIDLLKTNDAIHPLPSRLIGARLRHLPRYVEMLQHVYDTLGWNSAEFRGYRLDVEYPIYGAQYRMGFKLPEKPADQ